MRALDAALTSALRPPALPPGFATRLAAALEAEERGGDWSRDAREALEREHRERLAELDAGYLRLRRRTLGTLLGVAFAAGAVLALGMPWLHRTLGDKLPYVLAGAGALIGFALLAASLRESRVAMRLLGLLE